MLAQRRRAAIKKAKREVRLKRKQANAAGDGEKEEQAQPRQEPKTLENMRKVDETVVLASESDIAKEEAQDEFSPIFQGEVEPKVLITTGLKPSQISFDFVQDMLPLLPHATYCKRRTYELARITDYSASRGFSAVLVVKDDHKELTTLTHVHVPDGPTAVYRLTSFVPSERVHGHGRRTMHVPELILNRFTTQLGHRVGRMLGSLWPHNPQFRGRQAVTLHNQRDFIFVRFHRYVFADDGNRARLQELGPRFTLKLRSLQRGALQHDADHEWLRKKGMGSRKACYL